MQTTRVKLVTIIVEDLAERYFENYAMVVYLDEVSVVRGEKYV